MSLQNQVNHVQTTMRGVRYAATRYLRRRHFAKIEIAWNDQQKITNKITFCTILPPLIARSTNSDTQREISSDDIQHKSQQNCCRSTFSSQNKDNVHNNLTSLSSHHSFSS
eukprot:732227_1